MCSYPRDSNIFSSTPAPPSRSCKAPPPPPTMINMTLRVFHSHSLWPDRQIRPQIAIQSGQESLRLRVSSLALALALSLGLGSLETSLPRWPRRKPARWLWLRLFLEPIKWPADQSCCCCSSLLSLLSAVHGNGNGNAEVVCRWTLH